MTIAVIAVTIVLVLGLAVSAAGKLTRQNLQVEVLRTVGVPDDRVPYLAVVELAGAVGLLAGFVVPALGVAAAIGVVLYFVGAVAAHLRVGDRHLAGAGGMLVLSVAALVLRVLTA